MGQVYFFVRIFVCFLQAESEVRRVWEASIRGVSSVDPRGGIHRASTGPAAPMDAGALDLPQHCKEVRLARIIVEIGILPRSVDVRNHGRQIREVDYMVAEMRSSHCEAVGSPEVPV